MHEPECCPNPDCHFHRTDDELPFPRFWINSGTYHTKVSGTVQRFRCTYCGKGFSERTGSIDYYTKKSLDYKEIFRAITSAESIASIARMLRCHPDSITNRIDRLGRNALASHARIMNETVLSENLCADGFESFDCSQYHPNNINLAIGMESQFLYGFTHCTLRRKGRMTEAQKEKRAKIEETYKPPPGALVNSFKALIENVLPLWYEPALPKLRLITDEHKGYVIALKRIIRIQKAKGSGVFAHEQFSSRLERTIRSMLFAVNYWDREMRKDIAAFRRESTCHTRNVSNGLLRLALYQFWHNYEKPHRVKNKYKDLRTHALMARIDLSKVGRERERLFTRRSYISHQMLNPEERKIWLKEHVTPLKKGPNWVPKYATIG